MSMNPKKTQNQSADEPKEEAGTRLSEDSWLRGQLLIHYTLWVSDGKRILPESRVS